MKGIFVNQNGGIPYADLIVQGYKRIETRNRNMLRDLVGGRVAIIKTRRQRQPVIVGYAKIERAEYCPAKWFDGFRSETLIPPGSSYDCRGKGKWFYWMTWPTRCDPYPLPAHAIRHGRSWAKWDE